MNALHVPCARGDFACLVRRPTQSKTSFLHLMRTPKIFSLFLPRKNFPSVSALQFFFCVLNGCIIYVNLNNKVRITKQSPSWQKFGVSHETVQQNTSVTMPAAGGKKFQVPPQGFRFPPPQVFAPPPSPPGKNNAKLNNPPSLKGETKKHVFFVFS